MSNLESPYLITTKTITLRHYNPDYGDDRICVCGHPYHRHFDSYEDDKAVGCKYCHCFTFEDVGPVKEAYNKLNNDWVDDDLKILLKFVKNRLEAENRGI